MSDKIGVLSESTVAAVGTNNAYTVPASKAARGRVFFRGTSGANSTLKMQINGIDVFQTGALTSGHVHYSSDALMYNTQTAASLVDGSSLAKTAMPFGYDYWLAAGDRVDYIIATADFGAMNVQFVGVEVDV